MIPYAQGAATPGRRKTETLRLLEKHIQEACSIGIWIPLTQGYSALIDREDAALAERKWSACVRRYANGRVRIYGVRGWRVKGKHHKEYLHHAVFGHANGDVDHMDGDSLNNRRSNLRQATRALNNANGNKHLGCASRWKGVTVHQGVKKWTAQLVGKHLGLFRQEHNAAQAWNFAAEEKYGDFARFNLP